MVICCCHVVLKQGWNGDLLLPCVKMEVNGNLLLLCHVKAEVEW